MTNGGVHNFCVRIEELSPNQPINRYKRRVTQFSNLLTDEVVIQEMGRRLAAARLERRMTQAELAYAAGVSKSTVERLEQGEPTQLANLIRCLRALGLLEALERLLPETAANPVELLKRRGRTRRRVRAHKTASPAASDWSWGDET
jgi:transcriptional regulator with XRE-family HTH domain